MQLRFIKRELNTAERAVSNVRPIVRTTLQQAWEIWDEDEQFAPSRIEWRDVPEVMAE